jgi:rhomboid family protein
MVMPIYDDDPLKPAIKPYVTWGLIALNVVIYAVEVAVDNPSDVFRMYGTMPVLISEQFPSPESFAVLSTLVTYMFLHANFWHLFSNMIFLWIFGDDIEDAMGRWRFLVFYLLCGIIAGLAFTASDPTSHAPLVGASGAIAGVVAAYLLLRPCAKVAVFIFGFIARISAYWVIGAWALSQVVHVLDRANDGVAYWSHVGGFVTGAVLFVLMRRADVPLLECMRGPAPPAPGSRFQMPGGGA